jgi:hypothetical protein
MLWPPSSELKAPAKMPLVRRTLAPTEAEATANGEAGAAAAAGAPRNGGGAMEGADAASTRCGERGGAAQAGDAVRIGDAAAESARAALAAAAAAIAAMGDEGSVSLADPACTACAYRICATGPWQRGCLVIKHCHNRPYATVWPGLTWRGTHPCSP